MSWSRLRARTAFLAPLALAAASCDRVYTASDYAGRGDEENAVPVAIVHVPSRAEIVSAWQLPPGSPWAAYQKLTLFSALEEGESDWELPDVQALNDVLVAKAAAQVVARNGLPHDAAWFIDLRGAASVAFAQQVNQSSSVRLAPIPTFNNWPAEDELVPAEETLAAIVAMPPPLAYDPAARPTFLLDSWRLAYKEDEIGDDVTDNRYALGTGDFPSADALLAQGIRRIVYVVPGTRQWAHEEDDLNDLFRDYEAHGIEIAIVGVADLLELPEEWAWDEPTPVSGHGWWPRWRFHAVPRPLVVHSPHFHNRARGGWGGALAVPGGGGVHFGHGGG